MDRWQEKWDSETHKGQWTNKLIGNISEWYERKHGQVTYEMTQFLTGHGHFGSYQKKIKKRRTERCVYCGDPKDNAEHTIFKCVCFGREKEECESKIQCQLTPENIIKEMMKSKTNWEDIAKYIKTVINEKEKDDRRTP